MTETSEQPASTQRRIGARSIAALIALILGLGLLPIGTVTYWGNRTVTDSERYIETMGPLAYSEQIQDSLSVFITDKIEEQVDPEALVNQVFAGLIEEYPSLKALVPIVAGAIDSLIAQVVDRLVRSEQFQELWNLANTAAQKSIMAILEGNDAGPVTLQGDEVVLDISALIDQVKQGLVDRGFGAAANISVPETDRQIVLLEAPQLAQIRTIYSLTSPIAASLIWIAVILLVGAVFLARRRPRMAAWAGGGAAVGGLGLVIGLGIGERVFVNTLENTPFAQASQTFYDQLLKFLYNGAYSLIVIGVIILAVGLYLCGARWAAELRAGVNNLASDIAGTIPPGPITNSGAWVASNARWLRVGVAAIFVLIVIIGNDLSVARTIWAAVIALILLALIQVWAATTRTADTEDVPA
ncbi:MAG: hypothetical protein ACO3CU_06685 [Candidatus Nanopelagicales bacterium]